MIFLRHLQYFYGSQSKKKITETVLVWSVSDTFFLSNQRLKRLQLPSEGYLASKFRFGTYEMSRNSIL